MKVRALGDALVVAGAGLALGGIYRLAEIIRAGLGIGAALLVGGFVLAGFGILLARPEESGQ